MEESVEKVLVKAVKQLSEDSRIKKVILFGSYAYGQPTQESDVDLCLVVSDETFEQVHAFDFLAECRGKIGAYFYGRDLQFDTVLCSEQQLLEPGTNLLQDVKDKGILLYENQKQGGKSFYERYYSRNFK